MHSTKTRAVLYWPRNKTVNRISELYINHTKTDFVPQIKSSGVYFSEQVTWNYHVDNVITKLCKMNSLLNKHKRNLPTDIKRILYDALLFSTLTYCHIIWGSTTKQNIYQLLISQKKAVRIIANVPWYRPTHIISLITRCSASPSSSIPDWHAFTELRCLQMISTYLAFLTLRNIFQIIILEHLSNGIYLFIKRLIATRQHVTTYRLFLTTF